MTNLDQRIFEGASKDPKNEHLKRVREIVRKARDELEVLANHANDVLDDVKREIRLLEEQCNEQFWAANALPRNDKDLEC